MDDVIDNARRFLEESLSDSMCQKFIDKGFSMEVLSLKLILEKLEVFCKECGLSRKPQHTVLISREAFDMFCKVRTKLMELGAVSRKETEKAIRDFYNEYMKACV